MAKAKPGKRRSFFEMTDAQREADVAKYDAGVPLGRTRALTAKERARWERARRGPGRPPKPEAEKAVRVLISIDPKLLARAHARAERAGKTLSGYIADALRAAATSRLSARRRAG